MLGGFCNCSRLGEWTSWPEVNAAYGSSVSFDDAATPAYILNGIRSGYASGVDYLTRGNLGGAESSYQYLARSAAQVTDPRNQTAAFILVGDLREKIDFQKETPSVSQDLRERNTLETGWVQEGVAERNRRAEEDARRERCYNLAAQRYGAAANIPGVPELVCDWQGYLGKLKWYAIAGVGAYVGLRFVLPALLSRRSS